MHELPATSRHPQELPEKQRDHALSAPGNPGAPHRRQPSRQIPGPNPGMPNDTITPAKPNRNGATGWFGKYRVNCQPTTLAGTVARNPPQNPLTQEMIAFDSKRTS